MRKCLVRDILDKNQKYKKSGCEACKYSEILDYRYDVDDDDYEIEVPILYCNKYQELVQNLDLDD